MHAYSASFSSDSAAVSGLMIVLAVAVGSVIPALSIEMCVVDGLYMFLVLYVICVSNMHVGVVCAMNLL